MRISLLGWRRSTLGIVTAVACASGLQITGCVRSSARDAGADLSQRAADAAIKAERAIADRNSRQPIFSSRNSAETSLAAKESAKPNEPHRGPRANPLADLLASKADRYPQGDPFIEDQKAVSEEVGRQRLEDSDLGAAQSFGSDQIQLTQHKSETPITGDGSAIAKPIAARSFPQSALPPTGSERFGNSSSNNVRSQQAESTGFKNTLPERPASKIAVRGAQSDQFRKSELGLWKTSGTENEVESRAADKFVSSKNAELISDKNWPQQHEHKQHVAALLNQSGSQHARGELHAAYRSALLASNLVKQYQLKLSTDDIDPETVAKEISAQIWGTSSKTQKIADSPDTSGSKAPEVKVDDQLPIITPRRARSIQHDQVFQTSDNFLNWQASEELPAADRSSGELDVIVGNDKPADVQDSLAGTNIRSALFASVENSEYTTGQQSDSSNSIQQTGNFNEVVESRIEWDNADAELLADDHVFSQSLPTASQMIAEPLAKPMPMSAEIKQEQNVAGKDLFASRGPLFAPIQEVNPFEANLVRTVEEFAPAEVESNAELEPVISEEQPTGRLKWGVLAFILATLSTLVGLKLNQSPPSEPNEKNKDEAEPVEQSLKISKAA